MPLDDYYKSYSFQLINLDVFFSTLSVFVLLFISPYLFSIDFLKPFKDALSDYEITDIYFSKIIPELDIPIETDILVVNTGVPTRNGFKELSDVNYAQIVKALQNFEPSTIAIDHEFTIQEDEKNYDYVKQVLSSWDNIIVRKDLIKEGKYFTKTNEISPVVEGVASGYGNFLIKRNKEHSTIRTFPPRVILGKDTLTHIAVKAAQNFNPDAVERMLSRKYETEVINYRGGHQKFEIIDAKQLYKGEFDPEMITNRIIIMGVVDTSGVSDEFNRTFYTPLNESITGRTFPDMHGVIINSNIVSMILTDEYFKRVPQWVSFAITFFVCYINMLFFGYIGWRNKKWYEIAALLTFVFESVLLAIINVNLVNAYQIQINFTASIIAAALSIPVFELYTDSFKPFFEWILRTFFGVKPKSIFDYE